MCVLTLDPQGLSHNIQSMLLQKEKKKKKRGQTQTHTPNIIHIEKGAKAFTIRCPECHVEVYASKRIRKLCMDHPPTAFAAPGATTTEEQSKTPLPAFLARIQSLL